MNSHVGDRRWFKWPSMFLYVPDVLVSPGLCSTAAGRLAFAGELTEQCSVLNLGTYWLPSGELT